MNVWQRECERRASGLRPAFTMIEILVVVIIMGIAAAVVVPMMGNYDNLRITSAARMTVDDLAYAQNVANTQMRKVYVVFNADGSGSLTSYSVAYVTAPSLSNPGDFVTRPGDGGPMMAYFGPDPKATSPLLYARIASLKAGTTATTGLGFDEQGKPLFLSGGAYVPLTAAAGTATIHITNAKNTVTQDVTVQPITGFVATQ